MSGEPVDIIDRANRRAEEILADEIAAARRDPDEGSDVCVDCDTHIPPARRQLAPWINRCLDCQIEHERFERAQKLKGET